MWNKQLPQNSMAGTIIPVEQSKQYQLNKEDFKKILVGACITLGGALLTYLSQVISNTNFGVYTPLVMTLATILVNTLKHFLDGN